MSEGTAPGGRIACLATLVNAKTSGRDERGRRPLLNRTSQGRIFKAQRPDSFSVAAYPRIDGKGNPSGQRRLLERTLERVVVDGKTVAWDAVFSVDSPDRDYYLIGEGHWQDREGCGGDQHAHWSFHVKTRA